MMSNTQITTSLSDCSLQTELIDIDEPTIKQDRNDIYDYESSIKHEDVKILKSEDVDGKNTNLVSFVSTMLDNQSLVTKSEEYIESKVTMHKCGECHYQTKYKVNVMSEEQLSIQTNKKEADNIIDVSIKQEVLEISEAIKETGQDLDFNISSINKLEGHKTSHQDVKTTLNETNLKDNLKLHQNKTNKKPDEVSMYKCDVCHKRYKCKMYLKKHQKTHLNIDEVNHYRCATCGYRTVCKGTFTRHLLIHMKTDEVTMYKCNACDYQTKFKAYLRQHQKVHLNFSEYRHFKCDTCGLQCRRSSDLKSHQKVHLSLDEAEHYQCATCDYRTVHLRTVKRHLLVHKNPDEMIMHKCDKCNYRTKYKGNLGNHYKKHVQALTLETGSSQTKVKES